MQATAQASRRTYVGRMMRTLRVWTYVFALVVIAITVPLMLGAGARSSVVAALGAILAVTPYVVLRAIEESTSESDQSADK